MESRTFKVSLAKPTKWQFDKSPHGVAWNNSAKKYAMTAEHREMQLDYFVLLFLGKNG